ncbi:MAG: ATP-binding cassette domain-containing protein, partial [Oscillospiraceae bacterium]
VPPAEIRTRIDEAMEKTGVYKFKDKAPHHLSGGQKQRVAIAGIIAMRPDCIVLDEPTAMLDPEGRNKVIKTIKSLNKDYGITVILITHYMNEAAQSDRVVVMNDGNIVKIGTPKEIFSQVEFVKKLSLDVPQTSEIAYELTKKGYPLSTQAISIEECAQQLYKFLEE